jgi:F0F1-type ATP synthase assembly protein I
MIFPALTGAALKPGKKEESAWDLFRRYGNLGIELFTAVLVGTGGGYGLDRWFGTSPLFLLLGFFFGSAAGFLNIFAVIASEEKKESKKGRSKEE